MAQAAKRTIPAGKAMLLIAALAAAGTAGYAIWQNGDVPAEAVPASGNAADPISVEALEQQTRADPSKPGPWAALGLAYFSEARFDDAARAYERASALDPGQAVLWSALGEARVMASRTDPMPAAAVAAFDKAIALDAKDPRARYFLAVKRDLSGDHAGAIGDWLALLEDTPAGAPWRADLIRTVEQVGKINAIDVASRLAAADRQAPPATMPVAARAIPGPTAADLRNAAGLAPAEQRDMAEGMVSRLQARLDADPKNVDGWIMLMRSRIMLNEPDKAAAALKTAMAANPARAAEIREQAGLLGVK